jgi:hypothetical protein
VSDFALFPHKSWSFKKVGLLTYPFQGELPAMVQRSKRFFRYGLPFAPITATLLPRRGTTTSARATVWMGILASSLLWNHLAFAQTCTPDPSTGQIFLTTSGASCSITGGSVNTSTPSAYGFSVYSGNTLTATNEAIVTSGASAFGAYVQLWPSAGGLIALTGGSVTTTGDSSMGLYATSAGSSITADGTPVQTQGISAAAVVAYAGGKITYDNSSISTSGFGAFGLNATLPGAEVDATNVTVTTSGQNGTGAYAYYNSLVKLNTVTINTSGDTAWGLDSDGYLGSGPDYGSTYGPTEIDGTNVTVTTTGPNSTGLLVVDVASANIQNSSITTTGATAAGVRVGDQGSVATLTNTPVTSTLYDAGEVVRSGKLDVTNSIWNGGRYGIYSTCGTSNFPGDSGSGCTNGTVNIVNFSGGSLASTQDAFRSEDTLETITLTNTMVTPANNILANALSNVVSTDPTQTSVVNLTASGSTASGNAIADSASTLDMSLNTGTKWTGASLNATNIALDSTSTWTMTASSTVSATTTNAGLIAYTAPTGSATALASYKTLTAGSYVGNDGTISLNTFLGNDSSPSDRLVINGGTATGTTALDIANTIGPGALTTGNGILVVDAQNGATTASGAFVLAGPVVAGGFTYNLVQVGQNWYLQSVAPKVGPSGGGGGDPPASVPALSPVHMLLLMLLLVGFAAKVLGRRRMS